MNSSSLLTSQLKTCIFAACGIRPAASATAASLAASVTLPLWRRAPRLLPLSGLPPKLPQRWADEFLQGLSRLAKRHGVQLAGGDISAAPKITADIIVTGQAPAGKALLRSSSSRRSIYVTGELGASTAELKQLLAGQQLRPSPSSCHFFPEPRLNAGSWLRRRGLATAIDLSDGLSIDLGHICERAASPPSSTRASFPSPARPPFNSPCMVAKMMSFSLLLRAPQKFLPQSTA